MKKGKIKKGLVIWYSQTGHTRRYGNLLAKTWEEQGLEVHACDYRDLDKSLIVTYDIIAAGSPVFYSDVPGNFRDWLSTIPEINGIPVAAFSTYGGEGGNQHNTACTLIEHLVDRGGVPVGINTFGNMSTFAITWSLGNTNRILKYKHLPDGETYENVKVFARDILERAEKNSIIRIDKHRSFSELMKGKTPIRLSKLFVGEHKIDMVKCIECGTCEKGCPVEAITLANKKVNTKECILCLGCVNNCPAGAVKMTCMGKKVYGFKDFLKRNKISIVGPESGRNDEKYNNNWK